PRGTEVSGRSFSSSDGPGISSDPILNLVAGSYTLTVAGSGDHTGSYGFRLLDSSSATALTPGTPVTGTLSPGTSSNLYRFTANAGDRFYFDEQSSSGSGNDRWRLIDPSGQQVWFSSLNSDVGVQSLTAAGTYTLLVEGYIGNTSPVSYGFNVQPVQDTSA